MESQALRACSYSSRREERERAHRARDSKKASARASVQIPRCARDDTMTRVIRVQFSQFLLKSLNYDIIVNKSVCVSEASITLCSKFSTRLYRPGNSCFDELSQRNALIVRPLPL